MEQEAVYTPTVGHLMIPQTELTQREALASYLNLIEYALTQRPGINSEHDMHHLEADAYLKISNVLTGIRTAAGLSSPNIPEIDRLAFKMTSSFKVDMITALSDKGENYTTAPEIRKLGDMVIGHLVAADAIADRLFEISI